MAKLCTKENQVVCFCDECRKIVQYDVCDKDECNEQSMEDDDNCESSGSECESGDCSSESDTEVEDDIPDDGEESESDCDTCVCIVAPNAEECTDALNCDESNPDVCPLYLPRKCNDDLEEEEKDQAPVIIDIPQVPQAPVIIDIPQVPQAPVIIDIPQAPQAPNSNNDVTQVRLGA